jgi:hypothetical protein
VFKTIKAIKKLYSKLKSNIYVDKSAVVGRLKKLIFFQRKQVNISITGHEVEQVNISITGEDVEQ